jgi:nucleoid DNA-binding protein
MANPVPVLIEPDTVSEESRRDRVYLAVSNHVNELTAEYVKDAVERYRARLAEAGEDPEATERIVKGPSERIHLNAQLGKEILAGITEIVFTAALREGYFRFPDGFGSFRVQRLTENPKPKRLPTGQIIPMPPNRVKFKYEDGAAVREALGLSKKTNYVRRYQRESRLSGRTKELLTESRE